MSRPSEGEHCRTREGRSCKGSLCDISHRLSPFARKHHVHPTCAPISRYLIQINVTGSVAEAMITSALRAKPIERVGRNSHWFCPLYCNRGWIVSQDRARRSQMKRKNCSQVLHPRTIARSVFLAFNSIAHVSHSTHRALMRADGPGCPQVRGRYACWSAQLANRQPAASARVVPISA